MKFWLLAHILNYTVVPPSHRVLYVNCMGFLWTVILCCVAQHSASRNASKSGSKGCASSSCKLSPSPRPLKLKAAGRSCSEFSAVSDHEAFQQAIEQCLQGEFAGSGQTANHRQLSFNKVDRWSEMDLDVVVDMPCDDSALSRGISLGRAKRLSLPQSFSARVVKDS
eukprot:CAMPEP_0177591970 /NCGR_PEP_ID=MMETSP0419_2-20121207/8297_1 /TAXON_ID=582737 /ORGANISM="Tetraselmis sp., Strain GSL018" /LENGTH=166 /DNA_ID=CAMNT_0019082779 /DNA_START=808 /DNA_END=1308 /DNA_ORIENTATION=-